MINQTIVRNNAVYYFASFFFMNLGRTLPHAILTIFLLDAGLSLAHIAYLQIAYMIAILLFEIPSGYYSDKWSRKYTYVSSVVFLFIAYLIIYMGQSNLYILIFAWILYGLSSALNSGTMESELITQIKAANKSVKKIVMWNSYISSISSALGAILGSVLYIKISSDMYLITFICFLFSFFAALFFKVDIKENKFNSNTREKDKSNTLLKQKIMDLFTNKSTQEIIVLYTLLSLFLQPYFQYWQVLFGDREISLSFFGLLYVVFQICNMLGTYIYGKLNYKEKYSIYILFSLILISAITLLNKNTIIFLVLFMAILTLFYIYLQDISVKLRERSDDSNISTMSSVIGTSMNLSSIIVLYAFSETINRFSLSYNFLVYFILFFILSIFCIKIYEKKVDPLLNHKIS